MTKVLGTSFQEQVGLFITIEIVSMVGIVVSVYMLGAGFAERLKKAFEWQDETV